MFQEIIYYWKSILSAIIALIVGLVAGAAALFYLQPSDTEVIVGSSAATVGGLTMRSLEENDVLLTPPLPVGMYAPLVRPNDLEADKAWILAYGTLEFDIIKSFYENTLESNGWTVSNVQNYDNSVVYTVEFDGYSGNITLAKVSAPGVNSTIQGVLSPV